MHTLFLPDVSPQDERIEVGPAERAHAVRVKRVRAGDHVRVLNGQGLLLTCEVERESPSLTMRVVNREMFNPHTPALHVYAPAPKGPRAADMVDALTQVGAASWTPLITAYAGKPISDAKLQRLERIVDETLKQSLRPWRMEIHSPVNLATVLNLSREGKCVVVAKQSGRGSVPLHLQSEEMHLVVGPEGGFHEDELAQAADAGATICGFGPHVMRIEIAAPVAAAIILREAGSANRPSPQR